MCKFEFDNLLLENSKEEVVSGITIDNKSTFDSHIKSICRKAGQKLGALLRITNYLNSSQKKLTFSGMIKSQLSYCPLIWMFSSRTANNLINKIHERSIRIVNGDNESNFENLLEKDKEITIHQRNLQIFMTEVFEIINRYAPPRENTHNLRNSQIILNENKKTVRYGSETTSYRTPLFWANLPEEWKLANSLSEYKSKIKTWKCDTYVCQLCRPFLQNLGFV